MERVHHVPTVSGHRDWPLWNKKIITEWERYFVHIKSAKLGRLTQKRDKTYEAWIRQFRVESRIDSGFGLDTGWIRLDTRIRETNICIRLGYVRISFGYVVSNYFSSGFYFLLSASCSLFSAFVDFHRLNLDNRSCLRWLCLAVNWSENRRAGERGVAG